MSVEFSAFVGDRCRRYYEDGMSVECIGMMISRTPEYVASVLTELGLMKKSEASSYKEVPVSKAKTVEKKTVSL